MHSINTKVKQKVIFLTAFKGDISLLNKCIKSLLGEMLPIDKWIIVLDNSKLKNFNNIINDHRITLLNYTGPAGAGNARNYGLDYIIKRKLNNFLLWPLDGDDQLINGSRSLVTKKFSELNYSMMSFGIVQIYTKSKQIINFSGVKKYRDLLSRYSTPCGSTIIRISQNDILKKIRFGKRKRANDQLFFLKAVNYYEECFFNRENILLNFKNENSLSSRKWKQPFYKFLVLVDLGLEKYEIIYYFLKYINFNLSQLLSKIIINSRVFNID